MTKHGHGLPRKRPGRSAKDEIDAELPALEPIEDLPVLEAIDDLPALEAVEEDEGPIKGSCAPSDDADFDTEVTLEVPDMPKKEVTEAAEAPLTRIAGAFASQLRHKKVVVRFTGDGLVGSAVKELVAERLKPQKPLLVVVKRGFGDETVLEGSLPTVDVQREAGDGEVRVRVATGDCEPADLPVALAPHLDQLAGAVKDQRVVFQFQGGAKPDAELREQLASALRAAGARSAAVGARVLFDRDLEERVQCSVTGNTAVVAVSLAGADADVIDALTLVLPNHAAKLDGENVRFAFENPSDPVQAFCVDFARNAGALRVAIGKEGDGDIVWPPLVSVRPGKGSEVELRLSPNGRPRAAVLASFVREAADHHDDTAGKDVVVDWPEDFVLDDEAIAALHEALPKLAPHRLACTVHGDLREPFVPEPITFGADGDTKTIGVDSEAGKPKDLQRAIDRRLPAHAASLHGQAVRIEVHGAMALSRTLKQSLCGAVAEAGAMRLEFSEGSETDVLLPPMLAVAEGDGGVTISCVPDGRDEAQQQRAVVRELEGVEVALQSVTIKECAAAQAIADYVMEQGASQVVLAGAERIRLHPPLFEAAEKKGKQARLAVDPTGDDAMDARMVERELAGRLKELGMLVGATVTIAWPQGQADGDAVQKVVAALRDKKASKVLLESGDGEPVQLHPEPAPVAEEVPELTAADAVAAPTAPAAAGAPAAPSAPATAAAPAPAATATAGGPLLRLLGRRDESVPPLVLIGVEAGDDEAHLRAIVAELEVHLPRFAGRAVLLVPQRGGVDVPVRKTTPLVQLLGQAIPQAAAATLVFRGPDAQGRPHFQVLHSTLRAMPVGGAFADPRANG
ncbi:MAG: hypothetical protein KAI24_23000 [Planctomycetes bacterium]|nr:hypothetical protein [Planctomycetota bacterium]